MTVQHAHVRVGHSTRHVEDHAVEQDQAGLLEQAAAELSGRSHGHVKHDIGDPRQLPAGLCVSVTTVAPSALAMRAKPTLTGVSPDPEMISSASPARIDGAETSPTKCTLRPRCMKRIAAICAARPERPWPEKNQRRSGSSKACTSLAKASASIRREKVGYFLSHGQPRPGLGSLSRIHAATSFGFAASVMALPTTTISGATAITASSVVGPMPPASETRKPRSCICLTASIWAVDVLPASRASVGEWTAT